MSHLKGQPDAELHHENGEHRSTARTADGRELERFERRISAHLAAHAAEEERDQQEYEIVTAVDGHYDFVFGLDLAKQVRNMLLTNNPDYTATDIKIYKVSADGGPGALVIPGHQLTRDEARERFLSYMHGLVAYWENVENASTHSRLDGLAFSILDVLDNGAGDLPAFTLTPAPHPEDEDVQREFGDNWWPNDISISGSLHERWYEVQGQ